MNYLPKGTKTMSKKEILTYPKLLKIWQILRQERGRVLRMSVGVNQLGILKTMNASMFNGTDPWPSLKLLPKWVQSITHNPVTKCFNLYSKTGAMGATVRITGFYHNNQVCSLYEWDEVYRPDCKPAFFSGMPMEWPKSPGDTGWLLGWGDFKHPGLDFYGREFMPARGRDFKIPAVIVGRDESCCLAVPGSFTPDGGDLYEYAQEMGHQDHPTTSMRFSCLNQRHGQLGHPDVPVDGQHYGLIHLASEAIGDASNGLIPNQLGKKCEEVVKDKYMDWQDEITMFLRQNSGWRAEYFLAHPSHAKIRMPILHSFDGKQSVDYSQRRIISAMHLDTMVPYARLVKTGIAPNGTVFGSQLLISFPFNAGWHAVPVQCSGRFEYEPLAQFSMGTHGAPRIHAAIPDSAGFHYSECSTLTDILEKLENMYTLSGLPV